MERTDETTEMQKDIEEIGVEKQSADATKPLKNSWKMRIL